MAKRNRKAEEDIIDLITGGSILLGGYTYARTQSAFLGILELLPAIILQTIKYLIKFKRDKKLKRAGIHEVDQMDGLTFEKYLKLIFREKGYKAKVTRAAGDYGADLILEKDGNRQVVQAKRYSKNVGIKAVQEITAALKYYQASEALVVTNSYFTNQAQSLAKENDVQLINREGLINLLLNTNPNQEKVSTSNLMNEPSEKPVCPDCNEEMELRSGKRGKFYGCVNFPKCYQTKSIS
ncbi:restriction endonuclease [Alkalibacillus aidingensis]|uniref:restriction endonuclease n=1 Tax=Alkalibacillus aidingensis TaxID=2747607 RepID=UPI001660CC67|nr:restriction endonuclease [Alkalibacillus aidingensis]